MNLHEALEILSLNKNSTHADLVRSFRRLAMRFHPDVRGSETGPAEMALLNEARELLESIWKRHGSFEYHTGERPKPGYTTRTWREQYIHTRKKGRHSIGIYYLYHLHVPGQRKAHDRYYRLVRKDLAMVLDHLNLLRISTVHSPDFPSRWIHLCEVSIAFFMSFRRAMECELIIDLHLSSEERAVFSEYRRASEWIDDGLREMFLRPIDGLPVRRRIVLEKLKEASMSISALLRQFPDSVWISDIQRKGELVIAASDYFRAIG